ncbi:MAG: Signal transduction histidine-protein kinase ArlS [Candidatus Dichloromethanomonas elyunquensis]|nr:MAG: Signal transduction histidine-protein kinase ArlS [Candidatus Dichloromethanomonas elyunquensis]
MKNKDEKSDSKTVRTRILKVIFFPVSIMSFVTGVIRKKAELSIRLQLSLRHIYILIKAVIGTGFIVIAIFASIIIRDTVQEDYSGIANIIKQDPIVYAEIKAYSMQKGIPVVIYDRNQNVLYSTATGREYGYYPLAGIIWSRENLYLAVNRSAVVSRETVQIITYSDVRDNLREIIKISQIILVVHTVILLISVPAIAVSGRKIFQPIREMTQTVKEISEKNLNLRINVSGSKNELKELALTFNEMMNRIEDQYNRQRQFVSDASHELRTPIAVIQGYAIMLDRWGKHDKEVLQESVDAIKNEAEGMNELIDKLLFLARHDNSTFVFEKEEFSLSEMLLETIKETQIIDTTHKINGKIDQEVSLYADKSRIKQAIRILIDNALKYSPVDGEITISLEKENNRIAISLKDTGIGMSQVELEHIFDRFYRTDKSRTKEKGGHGLGLAIAKIIILGHNGKIKVRSKVGEGSEFIIFLEEGIITDLK